MTLLIMLIIIEAGLFMWSIAAGQSHKKERTIVHLSELAIIIILCIFNVLEWGVRYYFIVVLLGLQGISGIIKLKSKKQTVEKRRRYTAIVIGNSFLYLTALIPALIFPEFKLPPVTGSYAVISSEYTWVDESRTETFTDTGEKRALTVKIWYPDTQNEKFPLIVFSHGAFGVIDSNASTCMELASHGYVVASIGHPYHSLFVKDADGKMTFSDPQFIQSIYILNASDDDEEMTYEESKKWMELRTGDENFVIDTLLAKSGSRNEQQELMPFTLIDADRIGLFGHSMGGASSAALGRQRSDIKAVIDLEGTMFGEYLGVENGIGVYDKDPYPVPILDVYSEEIFNQAKQIPEDYYANFFAAKRTDYYDYVIFKDAGHLNFTDLPIVSPILAGFLGTGSVDARTCIENVNHVVLTYFDAFLKGDGTYDLKREY